MLQRGVFCSTPNEITDDFKEIQHREGVHIIVVSCHGSLWKIGERGEVPMIQLEGRYVSPFVFWYGDDHWAGLKKWVFSYGLSSESAADKRLMPNTGRPMYVLFGQCYGKCIIFIFFIMYLLKFLSPSGHQFAKKSKEYLQDSEIPSNFFIHGISYASTVTPARADTEGFHSFLRFQHAELQSLVSLICGREQLT